MSLGAAAIISTVQDHALKQGVFERVNKHEPKAAPGKGLTCAIWLDRVTPLKSSGLAKTSVLLVLNVRIMSSMLQEPQDGIDGDMADAADKLLTAYSGDFQLGGAARNVDLLGEQGTPLSGQAGYVNQDNRLYRVFTITLPIIVDDVWDQVA